MKKNMLVIAPVMPQRSEIELFASTLAFLEPYYNIDFLDPLLMIDICLENKAYYSAWQHYLTRVLNQYHAFMGFSFGGVILQQCFPLFEHQPHSIILFSTPTCADAVLKQKLRNVIGLCENNQVEQALDVLYKHVYSPNQQPAGFLDGLNQSEAAERLVTGLKRVLNTDSSHLVETTMVNHLHLIGEYSDLVNAQNVLAPKAGQLISVPSAGMRVLQDNLLFCKQILMDELL